MDACVLLESPSCTLRHVLGCFEIDTGVAMTFSGLSISIRFVIDFSIARVFSTEPHKQE